MQTLHKCRIHKLNNESGVTLVELIIVVGIMGAMLGALALSTGFVSKSRITKAYNTFQSEYSTARNETMTKATSCDLKLVLDDGYYYIQVGQEDRQQLITSHTPITFDIYINNTQQTGVSFDDMALKQGTPGTVTFSFVKGAGSLKPYADGSYIMAVYIGNKGLYITFETGKYSTEKLD